MRVGILGSGLMGGKLGTIFARVGHEVVFSYPTATRSSSGSHGRGKARPGTPREAAQEAEVLLLAVHWSRIDDVLKQTGDLSGKVVVTCSLPMNDDNTELASSASHRMRSTGTANARTNQGATAPPSIPDAGGPCLGATRGPPEPLLQANDPEDAKLKGGPTMPVWSKDEIRKTLRPMGISADGGHGSNAVPQCPVRGRSALPARSRQAAHERERRRRALYSIVL